MLQLKNNTPFAAQLSLFPNEQGIDTLYILVKASFKIGSQWTLLDKQAPPQAEDEYWSDDPATSSIKYASDIHIGKPATDVIIIGNAWAPESKEVRQMNVNISVGQLSKRLQITGDRQWHNGVASSPEPFSSMPIVYERAFGGIHEQDGVIVSGEERNPVGCGFAGKRKPSEMNDLFLPNIENPAQLIRQVGDVADPAGFGVISPSWQPRVAFAGTYDESWQENQAPYLPKDFDARFFNMAHHDLIYPGYINGNEPVLIEGMHPQGALQFNLPVVALSALIDINKRSQQTGFNLETLQIEPEKLELFMTWKAAIPCDKESLKIKQVTINLGHAQSEVA